MSAERVPPFATPLKHTKEFQHKILQCDPLLSSLLRGGRCLRQHKNLLADIIKGRVPEERAGIVQHNVKDTVLPHTLPVHRTSENFIHHLADTEKQKKVYLFIYDLSPHQQ